MLPASVMTPTSLDSRGTMLPICTTCDASDGTVKERDVLHAGWV